MKARKYDQAFKDEAVRLCEQEGNSVRQIARELGIRDNILYRWRSERGEAKHKTAGASGEYANPEQEIRRLQKELARAQMERDILKKALGVFSQGSS
jgi:transposase-like protein